MLTGRIMKVNFRYWMVSVLLMALIGRSIDRAHKLLRLLGWSFGEMCFQGREQPVWQVFARRDADRIVVRAPSQAAAWDEALRQAGIVQRG